KKEPVRKYGIFCFYIAPGKRQVRFAYLPYKSSVGWVSTGAPTDRLHWQVRSAYLPYKTCRRVGKRKRTHLPATEKTQKIKTKKAQHTLGFYVVISGELNRRR
ncbi:hypothetical protein, partial [Cronobacter sakazakii]|uniref:hypothetical protein n=2 Tax=Cronobacter sakazakii TaxID=28141 RepID=UPI001F50F834